MLNSNAMMILLWILFTVDSSIREGGLVMCRAKEEIWPIRLHRSLLLWNSAHTNLPRLTLHIAFQLFSTSVEYIDTMRRDFGCLSANLEDSRFCYLKRYPLHGGYTKLASVRPDPVLRNMAQPYLVGLYDRPAFYLLFLLFPINGFVSSELNISR